MVWLEYVVKILFVGWVGYLSVWDIRRRRVPVWGVLAAGIIAVVGCVNRLLTTGSLISIGLGILPGIFLIILATATKKMGLADGIILCLMGLLDKYSACVITFCIASFAIAIVSIILLATKKVKRNTQLPFIPFLAMGFIVQQILTFL